AFTNEPLAARALEQEPFPRRISLGNVGFRDLPGEHRIAQFLRFARCCRIDCGATRERIEPEIVILGIIDRHVAPSSCPNASSYHSAKCCRARLRHCEMNSRVAPGVRLSNAPISSWLRPSSTIQLITAAWLGAADSKRCQQR